MDLVLKVQQDPGLLFLLGHPEIIKYAKESLEAIGFIKKVSEKTASLIELLRGLKNGKPEKVEQKGPNEYEFHAGDGAVIPVNSTVNALYNSPVINKNTYNIIIPAAHENVTDILTYLKSDPEGSRVRIDKKNVSAIQAYSNPNPLPVDAEVYEDTAIRVLHPKSGNYGQVKGTWQFYIAGQKGSIKAKISDTAFLLRYANGEIRFHQADRLKVKLYERQIVEGDKTRMEYEIIEVLEYVPSVPMEKAG